MGNYTKTFMNEADGAGSDLGGSTENLAEPAGGVAPPATGESWLSALPEDLRNNPTLQDTKSVEALAKRFVDTKSALGASIRIPGEDASDEVRQEFYEKLNSSVPGLMATPDLENPEAASQFYASMGRPEEADSYRMPEITAPEGVEVNTDTAESFKSVAHAAGLNQTQFESIVGEMTGQSLKAQEAAIAEHEAGLDRLGLEWGQAFDSKISDAKRIQQEFFPHLPSDMNLDVPSLRAFAAIAKQMGGEATGLTAEGGRERGGALTPTEAAAQLDEIMGNREHAYWKSGHPQQGAAMAKVQKLMQAADPGLNTGMTGYA